MTNNRLRVDHGQVKLSNIFSDTNHDARFESMRRNTRSARVLRRHEDLRKQCEKEVRAYERWQKLAASELRQLQSRYLEKLRKFKKSLSYHPSSQPRGPVITPTQREVSSANTIPHYVRSRGSLTPVQSDREDPDLEHLDSHRSQASVEQLDSHRSQSSVEQPDSHRSQLSVGQLDSHRSQSSVEQSDSYRSQLSVGQLDSHRSHSSVESPRIQTPRDDLKLPSPRARCRSGGTNSGAEAAMESLRMSSSTVPDTPRISDPRRRPGSKTVTFSSPIPTPRSARSSGTLFPSVTDVGQRGRASGKNTGVKVTAEMVELTDLRNPKGKHMFSVTRENGTETYSKGNKKIVTFFV
ncbi:uncharacterized protein LOC124136258 [Haliotis rufescens]|uniref:uncharacterized protein LOC124136258 n=1 Tax=Haliotis rufescens TaxID=6454 RepID=UPI00201F0DDE|nr:uncharacterized protein LOC124136258 [Haliotis rufescens]